MQDVTPTLDVLSGRREGVQLQRVYNHAKTPYKSITAATHGYHTDQARKRANRTSNKNTYEPRTLIPNALVAQYGTLLRDIEKAGWFQDLGTFDRHYEKVKPSSSLKPRKVYASQPKLRLSNMVMQLDLACKAHCW